MSEVNGDAVLILEIHFAFKKKNLNSPIQKNAGERAFRQLNTGFVISHPWIGSY